MYKNLYNISKEVFGTLRNITISPTRYIKMEELVKHKTSCMHIRKSITERRTSDGKLHGVKCDNYQNKKCEEIKKPCIRSDSEYQNEFLAYQRRQIFLDRTDGGTKVKFHKWVI